MDGQAGSNSPINMGAGSYPGSERYLHIMQKQLQKNKPTVRRFHFSTQLCTSDAYRLENHCSEAVLSLDRMRLSETKNLPPKMGKLGGESKACHLLYLLERSLFSSSCVPGTEAESPDRFPQTLPRCCYLLRNPPGNVSRLEEPVHCVIHVAFCPAHLEGSLLCSFWLLSPSSPWAAGARRFLPTALPSCSSPHSARSSCV